MEAKKKRIDGMNAPLARSTATSRKPSRRTQTSRRGCLSRSAASRGFRRRISRRPKQTEPSLSGRRAMMSWDKNSIRAHYSTPIQIASQPPTQSVQRRRGRRTEDLSGWMDCWFNLEPRSTMPAQPCRSGGRFFLKGGSTTPKKSPSVGWGQGGDGRTLS